MRAPLASHLHARHHAITSQVRNEPPIRRLRSLHQPVREPQADGVLAPRIPDALPRGSDHLRHRRRAHGRGDRRAGRDRHLAGCPPRPHLHEPHDQAVSGLLRFLRHGRDDRAHRRLLQARGAGPRGAQADHLPARPGRRRQVLARRAAEGADGKAADLRAEGRRPDQPGVRIPARPVRSRPHGQRAAGQIQHPAPVSARPDVARGR